MVTFSEEFSWLIVLLPVFSFVAIGLTIIASGKAQNLSRAVAPWILIICLMGSLIIAVGALQGVMQNAAETVDHAGIFARAKNWHEVVVPWLVTEPATQDVSGPINRTLSIGVLLDPLAVVMLVVVALVSLIIQIYSFGYMKRDEHPRFYLFMSLFTASMLGLVISSTLLQLFICWELVGLCSYLLIGFWYTKPEAARAAIKAFVVTRFGDLGLLIAVISLWMGYGDLSFSNLYFQITVLHNFAPLPMPLLAIATLIFLGACGKSAQFPLHIWLPDAMEGPTSVSALIHAATMVAAGIFLVSRMFFLFAAAPESLLTLVLIGGFTAFLAATIALGQVDMKKVLAYSTISQLGYMMMGLGLAAPAAAFFHLTTHAFFKALLFLTAGSVIHATNTQNIWEMGGLYKKMKVTAITCLLGGLALAGIWPLAGFFSKDKLLEAALATVLGQSAAAESIAPVIAGVIAVMAFATVFMTAFYTTRMWILVFWGKPRTSEAEHAHESPFSMTFSLVTLAALTLVAGFLLVPKLTGLMWNNDNAFEFGWLGALALSLALVGAAWSFALYSRAPAKEPLRKLGWAYTGIINLWYIDAFFTWIAQHVVLVFGRLIARFDKGVVDGKLVDGTAWLTGRAGVFLRRISAGAIPGQLQYYAMAIFMIAALVILLMTMLHTPVHPIILGGLCQ